VRKKGRCATTCRLENGGTDKSEGEKKEKVFEVVSIEIVSRTQGAQSMVETGERTSRKTMVRK